MTADELAALASATLEPVYDALHRVAEEVLRSRPPRTSLTEAHFSALQRLLADLITADEGLWGMGFVAAPSVVDGRERYMAWWQRHDQRVARLRLNFDPDSIDVYDYLQMDWYQLALRGQQVVAYGPYVDYSGSDMYTITATVPVMADDTFLGVAGADLVVGDVERRLIEVLRHTDRDAVVVNTERRVIAANTPRWYVGSRLPAIPAHDDTFTDIAELPLGMGWAVALARP
ncbi:cache domain-containing protein [Mycolicibacterium neoaurum]|uniref:cache domain-containing protein n=1 Tax=Mycolicibacterium neoaurum TaxID=1795 RepID=UPI00248BAE71|nr:cache domain-containing protein [Mycolicibacterium neoaurum]MDO3401872.1 cache domain-containing protein [Mycolicibacterium neoaurum]WBP95936.1 cache domain-containing protein [Mycolicibacterium neoaurum]WBS09621.1 cache domain-containing protein [Mycolicibacterium neoaurum]